MRLRCVRMGEYCCCEQREKISTFLYSIISSRCLGRSALAGLLRAVSPKGRTRVSKISCRDAGHRYHNFDILYNGRSFHVGRCPSRCEHSCFVTRKVAHSNTARRTRLCVCVKYAGQYVYPCHPLSYRAKDLPFISAWQRVQRGFWL